MRPGLLVIACGNTLRGDDGVGWKVAEAIESDVSLAPVEVITTQQLTPELAEPLSAADTVIFVDCSADQPPGTVVSFAITASAASAESLTHHMEPATLLALTLELYGKVPRRCFAVLVGGASFELSEDLTDVVRLAVPAAAAEVKRVLSSS